jgi:hypothetical protein
MAQTSLSGRKMAIRNVESTIVDFLKVTEAVFVVIKGLNRQRLWTH